MVINIFIKPLKETPKDPCDIAVEARGCIEEPVSDKHLEMFQISNKRLKEGVQKLKKKEKLLKENNNPVDTTCFTPCGNPCWNFIWDEVTTRMYPVSTEVLHVYTERVDVVSKSLVNNSKKSGTYATGVMYEEQNTVTKSWKTKKDMKLGLNVDYKLLLPSYADISFHSSFGENAQQSNAVTIGSHTGIEVELDPGEKVVTNLRVTRYAIKVKVSYNVCLNGYIACQSAGWFKSCSKRYQVDDLLEAGDLPSSMPASEEFKICFCTDGEVVLSDR